MTETQDIEVKEVECPRRGCLRNDSGICEIWGPDGHRFEDCPHARIPEDVCGKCGGPLDEPVREEWGWERRCPNCG